jgi:hypothetical protein
VANPRRAASGKELEMKFLALPSVLIFRLDNGLPLAVNKRLDQVIQESYIALSAGALIIVEDARHRVRLLPVK